MPNWKKVITSGSEASLNKLVVDGSIGHVSASLFSGSFYGDGSNLTGIEGGIFAQTGSIYATTNELEVTGSLVIDQSSNGQAIEILNANARWKQYIDGNGHITLNASGSGVTNVNYTLERGHFNVNLNDSTKDFRVKASGSIQVLNVTGDRKIGIGPSITNSPQQDVQISGSVRLQDYGSGDKTGTLAYTLGVDSNGDIIETTGGSTSPGGSDGQIQYNNGGTFGGESTFTYDDTNNTLTVEGATNQPSITLSNAQSVTIANGSQLSEIQTHYASNEVGTVAFVAEGAFNPSDTPTRLELRTTTDGAGSPTTKFQIKNDGKLIADTYGSGTHTGTAAKYLAVDSSGNIIEEDTSTVAVYTPDVYEISDVSITSFPYFFEYSTTKVIDGSTNTAVNTAGDGITISDAGMYEAKYSVAMQTFDTVRKNPAIRAEYNSGIIKGSRGITYTRITGTNSSPFGSIEVSFYFNVSAGTAGNDLKLKMTLLNGSGNLTVDGYHATSNTLSIRRIS